MHFHSALHNEVFNQFLLPFPVLFQSVPEDSSRPGQASETKSMGSIQISQTRKLSLPTYLQMACYPLQH